MTLNELVETFVHSNDVPFDRLPPAGACFAALLPFSCKCGARRYATEAARRAAEPNGLYKCPTCHTFASDHEWYGDESSDFRCYACDTRYGSHGVPPKP